MNVEIELKKVKTWIARIERKVANFPEIEFVAEKKKLASLKARLANLEAQQAAETK